MCGIAGIMDFAGRPVTAPEIRLLTQALSHRGPDGDGHWFSKTNSVALGHRRLAIIDTTDAGAQPMAGADGRYVITYNGEIYNFLELRAELEALGRVFTSNSDTEVILWGFLQWGEAVLSRFNGMWALAIYDTLKDELFIARDRYGVKPLHYAWTPQRFVFASELKALRKSVTSLTEIDGDVACRLLVDPMRVEGSARTLFAGANRLQGGCCAWVSGAGVRVRRWWNTLDHLVAAPRSAGEQQERFRELFLDAVALRMRSDVPIGTCLSGGFDSTAVTCAMARVAEAHAPRSAQSWRHAFVASFPGWQFDERGAAEEAAAFAGITPNILEIDHQNALACLNRAASDIDEVYIDPGVNGWMIYRAVREGGVVVTLDGHGADELMGAYMPAGGGMSFSIRNAAEALSSQSATLRSMYDHARRGMHRARGLDFLSRNPGDPLALVGGDDRLPDDWGQHSRNLYAMFHSTILPTLLRNYDRASMAHGVEVRMPFMDWRLVSYVMSLPDRSKLSDGYSKKIARDSLQGLMPESIRTTKLKLGFNSPMAEFLRGPLQGWVGDVLDAQSPAFSAIVDEARLAKAIKQFTAEGCWNIARAQKVWPYLSLKSLLVEAGL